LDTVVVRAVEDISTGWTERLIDVELGNETIASTGSHPYWEATTRTWMPASELRPGLVVQLKTGSTEIVRSVRERRGIVEVHNFVVAGEHNYFVGEAGVLVHNGRTAENDESFRDYNQARNAALKWLTKRGFRAEKQVR